MPAYHLLNALGLLLALTAGGSSSSDHASIREKLSTRGLYLNIMAENQLKKFNSTSTEATLWSAGIDSSTRWNEFNNRSSCAQTQIHFFCDRLAMYDLFLSVRGGQRNDDFIENYTRYLNVTMDSSCRLWVCSHKKLPGVSLVK